MRLEYKQWTRDKLLKVNIPLPLPLPLSLSSIESIIGTNLVGTNQASSSTPSSTSTSNSTTTSNTTTTSSSELIPVLVPVLIPCLGVSLVPSLVSDLVPSLIPELVPVPGLAPATESESVRVETQSVSNLESISLSGSDDSVDRVHLEMVIEGGGNVEVVPEVLVEVLVEAVLDEVVQTDSMMRVDTQDTIRSDDYSRVGNGNLDYTFNQDINVNMTLENGDILNNNNNNNNNDNNNNGHNNNQERYANMTGIFHDEEQYSQQIGHLQTAVAVAAITPTIPTTPGIIVADNFFPLTSPIIALPPLTAHTTIPHAALNTTITPYTTTAPHTTLSSPELLNNKSIVQFTRTEDIDEIDDPYFPTLNQQYLSFMSFPFVLSSSSKAAVLEADATLQMKRGRVEHFILFPFLLHIT